MSQTQTLLRSNTDAGTEIAPRELEMPRELDRIREDFWSALTELEHARAASEGSTKEMLRRLTLAAEYRDDETGAHVQRMSQYSEILALRLTGDRAYSEMVREASAMHDVGKIGISDRILLKPGKLTSEEFDVIKEHCIIGHRILDGSDSPVLQMAATIALTHHERFDGTGYPFGLRGKQIPVEGRIAAVADVFDALTSDRVYRQAFAFNEVLTIMRRGRGTHFDPCIFDLWLEGLPDLLAKNRSLMCEAI